jgi:FkbH-like protein
MQDFQNIKSKVKDFGFNDYFRQFKQVASLVDQQSLKPLRLAVLRSYTAEMIEPILKLRLMLEGYAAEFFFGDFNQYAQEILDVDSPLYKFGPDVVLLLIRIEEVMPEFIDEYGQFPFEHWQSEIAKRAEQIAGLAMTLASHRPCQILIQNLVSPTAPFWGGYDAQTLNNQQSLVNNFNGQMADKLQGSSSINIWDFQRLVRQLGADNIYDPKAWYSAHNPYRQKQYPQIAGDLLKYLRSALGRQKKCIVLDLDNTLWGGIAGEDGMDGVQLGHDYPGSCYCDFQRALLKLYHRGIILAINSKNNEEDALEIIDKHPYMVLKREHFAAFRINWLDKSVNMSALAHDLNIGIDSMVFIDDNPVECELVSQQHPECEVVCLPEQPYLLPQVVEKLEGFENLKLTKEDREKGKMYQAQVARKQFETIYQSLDDFLANLEMEVFIERASNFTIPRISQLTQKTNQMNLTTRRYTDADIQSFVDAPDQHVFCVGAKDRFGDNGIIGVFILCFDKNTCRIDTFLLSCRVISRHIEDAMIAYIAEFAEKQGADVIIGEYLPTRKNKPAAEMYSGFGFEALDEARFKADLRRQKFPYSSFIKCIIK